MRSIFLLLAGGIVGAIFGGLGGGLFGAISGALVSLLPDTDDQDDETLEIHSGFSFPIMGSNGQDFEMDNFRINPATGLPMMHGSTGFDVEGNPYGIDLSSNNSDSDYMFSSGDSFDGFSDLF
jgi:hypothetical protein